MEDEWLFKMSKMLSTADDGKQKISKIKSTVQGNN